MGANYGPAFVAHVSLLSHLFLLGLFQSSSVDFTSNPKLVFCLESPLVIYRLAVRLEVHWILNSHPEHFIVPIIPINPKGFIIRAFTSHSIVQHRLSLLYIHVLCY